MLARLAENPSTTYAIIIAEECAAEFVIVTLGKLASIQAKTTAANFQVAAIAIGMASED
ncbi:MAG TPA: hypothetical protein VKB53_06505 [Gammaproteobacteria bacterium]|nr:hypothetical protein [Gammaproteobacteria bacterium]